MSKIEVGKPVPDFSLKNENDKTVKLSDFRGKCVVVYFYPKDNTPGCTVEAKGFRDFSKEFESLNTVVLGISRDSVKSHLNFAKKFELNFHLLSDPDGVVHEMFDVLRPKKMFGKEFLGTERSTFVIAKDGTLIKEFRKVNVKTHVQEVLEFIRGNCAK